MMLVCRNLLSGKRRYLVALILLLLITAIWVAFAMAGSDDFSIARREVLLRRIGHETLLQSGDSTSRVLPVKKLAENEYQISFEQTFTFQPDSLVNTTRRVLSQDPLASNYVVNVINGANDNVTYGYAISKNKKDDIIACRGRMQPEAAYVIHIRFQSLETNTAKIGFLMGGLALLTVLGCIFLKPATPRTVLPGNQHDIPGNQPSGVFTLGSMSFDAEARKLVIDGKSTELTKTEARVLRIFALAPNEVIDRSRLQKEIWEDEGVIVGRSLDMFISKLRKKLDPDPTIKIAVIRGKGYKLEIATKDLMS
ncbi:winged helix-turn-helix domain-containing protein [Chitinophaga sp.]|uniref:winged helix-turn-helix domain-containing protein n=1 Tax=Chitinophaga sp. TaxID=1869181 RepID=UPI002635CA6B|nr:winged helix-turn-helix domain-containing protein [uncultured Chitinophaga sp.]